MRRKKGCGRARARARALGGTRRSPRPPPTSPSVADAAVRARSINRLSCGRCAAAVYWAVSCAGRADAQKKSCARPRWRTDGRGRSECPCSTRARAVAARYCAEGQEGRLPGRGHFALSRCVFTTPSPSVPLPATRAPSVARVFRGLDWTDLTAARRPCRRRLRSFVCRRRTVAGRRRRREPV